MHAVTPEMNAAFLSKIPMGRFCKPEEVAAMIAFLLGDDLSFTTGSVFDLIRNSPEQFSLPTIATQGSESVLSDFNGLRRHSQVIPCP